MQLPLPYDAWGRQHYAESGTVWCQFPQIENNPNGLSLIVHADAKAEDVALAVALIGQIM